MIDQGTVDRIFEAAQIMDIVQDFISLKRRGVNYLGICPFHNEKTPSFTVSPAKNIYKCFGCSKGGNPVNFIMEHEKISYYEALKYLAKRYNIEVVESHQDEEDQQVRSDRESLMIVTDFARKTFCENLYNHPEGKAIGLSYFKERGFRDDTIRKFELGYSLEERDVFTRSALKAGYKPEYLVKSGLSIQSEGHAPFDRFSGRVMFPIHNFMGKVIAFGARVMKTDKKTAKYLNSPESDIYHKSNVLYGIYQAKQSIIHENKCYLVEGYTDVISMHQAGVENVVASSGTSLTMEQIRLIKRFTNNVTILYDGDPAGIKASLRGIDLILGEGMNVRVILLPEPEDPDSFARTHSITELTEYLRTHETDFIHFKTSLLLDEVGDDPVKRSQAISDIVKSIGIVPDAITRLLFLRECSKLLQVDEGVLYAEVSNQRRQLSEKRFERNTAAFTPEVNNTIASPIEINELEVVEKEIIRLMLSFGPTSLFTFENEDNGLEHSISVTEYFIQEIEKDELEFSHPLCRRIFQEYQHGLAEGMVLETKRFVNSPDPDISKITAGLITEKHTLSKGYRKKGVLIETEDMKLKQLVPEIILIYKSKRVILMLRDLQAKLMKAQIAADIEMSDMLQQQIVLLNGMKNELSKNLKNRIFM